MINPTQITVRTFHKGKKISKKYYDDNNLAAVYPSHYEVITKYTSILTKGNTKKSYYLDISETGISVIEH